jgi:hypothetical protein
MALPDRTQQVIQTYATFIHGVATACAQPQLLPHLQPLLTHAEQQGWNKLVTALRLVIAGRRDSGIYAELDDDERIIVEAILRGIQDPATLPDPAQAADPNAAAPGLAAMVQASANGDAAALSALANMAEQMVKAGGDMAKLGGNLRRLVHGERDVNLLTRGMSGKGRDLMAKLVAELEKNQV